MDQSKVLLLSNAIWSKNILNIKQVAISKNGLLSLDFRKAAWPLLLGVELYDWKSEDIVSKDSDIIYRDVERSLFGIDLTDRFTEDERIQKRKDLSTILNCTIKNNPELYYPQGFNQICTIFYVTGGLDMGFLMSEKCALKFLKDVMRKKFEEGFIKQLYLIYNLLDQVEPLISDKLKSIYSFDDYLDIPAITVPWNICWFSSSLSRYEDIARIFDFCLGTHALAPVYLSVALLKSKKKEILACAENSDVHVLFREIDDADVDELCLDAFELMTKVHPVELASKSKEKFLPE